MALNNNFYSDIIENEKKWDQMINSNLLNIYYIKAPNGIRNFYLEKLSEIKKEYNSSDNEMINGIIKILSNIILKIDSLIETYNKGETVDINSLSNLFYSNIINNNISNNNLHEKIQNLKALKNEYTNSNDLNQMKKSV
ncbi:MAG: hypothetical protein Q4E75_04080 [bacterium]|nr:hypothetical protein [bacterium]